MDDDDPACSVAPVLSHGALSLGNAALLAGNVTHREAGVRPRVLLVDDEPMVLTALRRVLQGGHEVDAVSDPALAMQRLADGERWDLVLCDMTMGPLSGRDVLSAALRADLPAHRFVFVTGGARNDADADFLRRWPHGLVRKPCSADEVLAAVEAALGQPT
jgi:CheY-like chemotaxis protein